jgi:hypothetical protein
VCEPKSRRPPEERGIDRLKEEGMRSYSASLFGSLLAAVFAASGCSDHHGSMSGRNEPPWEESGAALLAAREESHHAAAREASAPSALRSETDRYAADMDSLIDAWMSEACGEMMEGGMMEGGMMTGMHGDGMGSMCDPSICPMGDMMDSVETHHARIDSMDSLGEMQEECDRHFQGMMQMMDRMGGEEGSMEVAPGEENGGSHDDHHM